jgi:hypothetical protein
MMSAKMTARLIREDFGIVDVPSQKELEAQAREPLATE